MSIEFKTESVFEALKSPLGLVEDPERRQAFERYVEAARYPLERAVFDLLSSSTALRDKLEANTKFFRDGMTAAGFEIKPGVHPIVPIMLYDEKLAHDMARRLLELGIYVIGFSFPVVPRGQARIRVQLSAGHERAHLERALQAFAQAGQEFGILKGVAR